MALLSAEQDKFLDQLTDTICRRGLRFPILLALDAGRPLAFLGGQMLWLLQPALSLIVPGQVLRQTAQLLEEPTAIAALVARLEAKDS